MNPVALYLASGESLYGGVVLLVVVVIWSNYVRGGWAMRVRNFLAWIGIALILLACVPMSWMGYAVLGAVYLLWFVVWNVGGKTSTQRFKILRVVSAVLLIACVTALVLIELPHRVMRTVLVSGVDNLVIIGDSISAGIDAGYEPWPGVFQRDTGMHVRNLSRPGIGVDEAIELTKGIAARDRVVLVEIGGNDLLSTVTASQFENELEQLLTQLAAEGRTVVMFELPLLPHKIGYGVAQRRLAEKYGVVLIPKRFFIQVLSGADATSDGLHLSVNGTHRMAELVERVLRIGPLRSDTRAVSK